MARGLDHAPAGALQAGIEPQQAHQADSRSSTSSSTSKFAVTLCTSSSSSSVSSSWTAPARGPGRPARRPAAASPARATSGGPRRSSRASRTVAEVVGRADDLVAVVRRAAILGAGLARRLEHRVGVRRLGRIADLADAIELEGDAAGLAERAAELGERGADVSGGAVAIVGQGLDDQGDAARAVALVAHLLVALVLVARPRLIARSMLSFGSWRRAPPHGASAGADWPPGRAGRRAPRPAPRAPAG